MLAALLMQVGCLGVSKIEYFVDRRLELVQSHRFIHGGEHIARADMNPLETDRLAVDHSRVNRAGTGKRANHANRSTWSYRVH